MPFAFGKRLQMRQLNFCVPCRISVTSNEASWRDAIGGDGWAAADVGHLRRAGDTVAVGRGNRKGLEKAIAPKKGIKKIARHR